MRFIVELPDDLMTAGELYEILNTHNYLMATVTQINAEGLEIK